ncbi:hypothetical protein L3Y34_007002 [Caenorhabditis briggsae]|uniref:Domain of unknown function WSN domain-containing protein n=1 Tax=Caenorhabditis briggsae TaxID=6238 RepID=A0AAE9A5M7_CAEBR|nr:hypothetical protein L3Y34_007002 [Caenorhabditis briggsae]
MNFCFLVFLLTFFKTWVSGDLSEVLASTSGHLECESNCVFIYTNLTNLNIAYFPTNCSTVCASIEIGYKNNVTEEQLEITFKNLKKLIGSVEIKETDYTRGKFLAGLESFYSDYGSMRFVNNRFLTELDLSNLTSVTGDRIEILGNSEMTQLKMPNLKNLTNPPSEYLSKTNVKVVIAFLSKDYCIRFDEMEHFLSTDGNFNFIYANYCTQILEDRICTKPEVNCTRFFGDLMNGPNFTDIEKNQKSWALQIVNNTKLQDFHLPNLKRIRSDSATPVIMENNSEEVLFDLKSCEKLKNSVLNVLIRVDGAYCFVIKENVKTRNANNEKNQIIMYAVIAGVYDSGVEWVSNMKMTELGLTNLKNISCNDFTISDNSKMTKLNMPKFENYQGTNNLAISRLASNFCMSGDEIKGFLTTTTVPATVEISGKLCDFVKNDKSCTKDVSDGCTDFYGDLTIGPNFSDLEKLKSLETIIGTLFLNATNFIDLSIFENLHYIIQIDQKKSALKVEGNEMLNSALFPSLKRIFSTSPLESVIFKNNHENLKNDPMTCYKIRNSVMPSSLWVPDFDDISCEDMKVVNTPAPETPGVTQVLGNPTVTPPPGHSETCPLADQQRLESKINEHSTYINSNDYYTDYDSPDHHRFRRAATTNDTVSLTVERMKMMARLTNAISLQKQLIGGAVDSDKLISELLHFGSVTVSQIHALKFADVSSALELLESLPFKLKDEDSIREIEQLFAKIDKVLKTVDGIKDVTVWPEKNTFKTVIDNLANVKATEFPLIPDLAKSMKKWYTYYDDSTAANAKASSISNLGEISSKILEAAKTLKSETPTLSLFPDGKSATEMVQFLDKVVNGIAAIREETEIIRLMGHFNDPWFLQTVKDKRLSKSLESLKSLEAANVIENILGSKRSSDHNATAMSDIFKIVSDLETTFATFDLSDIEPLKKCLKKPGKGYKDADVKTLIQKATAIDQKLEELRVVVESLQTDINNAVIVSNLQEFVRIGQIVKENDPASEKKALEEFGKLTIKEDTAKSVEQMSTAGIPETVYSFASLAKDTQKYRL